MLNFHLDLDLLFYVGHYVSDQSLVQKAISHARTVMKTLVRGDYSTFHVANLDPQTGFIQFQHTHQGYKDESCWTRYVDSVRFACLVANAV